MDTMQKIIKKQRIEKLETLETKLYCLKSYLKGETETSMILELENQISVIKDNIVRIQEDLWVSGVKQKNFKIPYFTSHPVYMIEAGLVPREPEQKIFETKAYSKKQAMNKMGIV